jgi:hypothetical protein
VLLADEILLVRSEVLVAQLIDTLGIDAVNRIQHYTYSFVINPRAA